MVKIKFLARLRDITGERSVNVDYDGTVTELINILTEKYGDEFKDALLDKEGQLRDYMKLFINSEDIHNRGGFDAEVKDLDEIVIFQTIAGG